MVKKQNIMGAAVRKKQVKVIMDKSKNQINTIFPYRTKGGTWAYDDEDLDVFAEAFVCGSSELIDQLVGKETDSFTANISAKYMPGYTVKLINIDETEKDQIQGWYQMEGTTHKNWFCGHLLDYFEGYPKEIYVTIIK
jgi:hypothetical protein